MRPSTVAGDQHDQTTGQLVAQLGAVDVVGRSTIGGPAGDGGDLGTGQLRRRVQPAHPAARRSELPDLAVPGPGREGAELVFAGAHHRVGGRPGDRSLVVAHRCGEPAVHGALASSGQQQVRIVLDRRRGNELDPGVARDRIEHGGRLEPVDHQATYRFPIAGPAVGVQRIVDSSTTLEQLTDAVVVRRRTDVAPPLLQAGIEVGAAAPRGTGTHLAGRLRW